MDLIAQRVAECWSKKNLCEKNSSGRGDRREKNLNAEIPRLRGTKRFERRCNKWEVLDMIEKTNDN